MNNTNEFQELKDKLVFGLNKPLTQDQIDRAFNLAWELGHSNGDSEVEGFFKDIVFVIAG